jgi:hypothetical protein
MAEPKIDMTNLGETIGAAVAQGIAAIAPRKELKEGDPEYTARLQAEGFYDTFDGGVIVLQNTREAQARGLSAEVRSRAAHLKPGSYIKNRVKVTVENDGAIVRLSYPVSGTNDALINQSHFSSFEDLITKIWQEMHATVAA